MDYNSVDIHLKVTIDNKAWYPDLGYVARVNHNRLASKMQSEGFNVVCAPHFTSCSMACVHASHSICIKPPWH